MFYGLIRVYISLVFCINILRLLLSLKSYLSTHMVYLKLSYLITSHASYNAAALRAYMSHDPPLPVTCNVRPAAASDWLSTATLALGTCEQTNENFRISSMWKPCENTYKEAELLLKVIARLRTARFCFTPKRNAASTRT